MSGIGRRLERLEEGVGRPCEGCGHGPGVVVEYDVAWGTVGPTEDGTPEACPACGRRLVHEVAWPDEGGGVVPNG